MRLVHVALQHMEVHTGSEVALSPNSGVSAALSDGGRWSVTNQTAQQHNRNERFTFSNVRWSAESSSRELSYLPSCSRRKGHRLSPGSTCTLTLTLRLLGCTCNLGKCASWCRIRPFSLCSDNFKSHALHLRL